VSAEVDAPAKVNLWLRIGQRRDTGFHDIDTLFCALELADTVRVEMGDPGAGVTLTAAAEPPLQTLPDMGPDAANLVVLAARGFAEMVGVPADLRIHLVKRIPAGGGLGGGSSDAAATLIALDRLFPKAADPAALEELAGGIGSDVPFFLAASAMAVGRGRGTLLDPVTPLPARSVVLLLPPLEIATARAYLWFAHDRADGSAAPPADALVTTPVTWAQLKERAVNDFETTIFRRHSNLQALRDQLRDRGAEVALLAGSGATVFGIFGSEADAAAAARHVEAENPGVRALVTRTRD
jgi:4-diphosphocytidyl-2-C-methyl-D-erythritol kinase